MLGALRRLWIPAPEADSAVASLKRSRTCVTGEGGLSLFIHRAGVGVFTARVWPISGSRAEGRERSGEQDVAHPRELSGHQQPASSDSGMCHSPCQCPREESLDSDITFLHIACWASLSKALLFSVSPKALQDLERKCLL